MMRSLFSGVSGLKNHQTRMDVIGNNISNVNTTGFKSGRANFTDMLSQNLTGAAAPSDNKGGTNAKQIGLGSSVGAIDLLFTNGSVQSTGKNTDLCLSGNGLFVVKDNSGTYYTRNGAFEFDADGNYVQAGNGLFVQGWMANNGKLTTTGGTGNIIIPAGKSMESAMSGTATYSNNLNATPDGYTISNITVMYKDGTKETTSNYTPTVSSTSSPKGSITLTLNDGSTYTVDPAKAGEYAINQTLDNETLYTTTISSVEANDTGGSVTLTVSATDANGNELYQSIKPTTIKDLTSETYTVGGKYEVTQTIDAAVADNKEKTITLTLSNDDGKGFSEVVIPLPENSPTYKEGDSFTTSVAITGIEAITGATVSLADGTTETLTADLTVSSADQEYDKKVSGKITGLKRNAAGTVTTFNGKDVSAVAINTSEGTTLTGLLGQAYSAKDTFYPSVVTTVSVYDTLGGAHDIPVLFTKTGENKWSMSLQGGVYSYSFTEDDNTTTTVNLESKDLTFDSSGAYTDGDATLTFKYGNGAADQKVDVNLSGLTQYIGSSTINADTDGHAAGTLSSVSIDTSGVITGTYTNGVKQAEAQVAVAQFNNASGLTKTGDSLYQESNNSGVANVKTASDLGVTITPSALEMSNVDVANEFTDMIITQRGFQSNSKIITTSDEMLETLINLKR